MAAGTGIGLGATHVTGAGQRTGAARRRRPIPVLLHEEGPVGLRLHDQRGGKALPRLERQPLGELEALLGRVRERELGRALRGLRIARHAVLVLAADAADDASVQPDGHRVVLVGVQRPGPHAVERGGIQGRPPRTGRASRWRRGPRPKPRRRRRRTRRHEDGDHRQPGCASGEHR